MVHPGHLSTPTQPGPPHSSQQLKFIPQCGGTVTHLDSPFWMGTCFQLLLLQKILYRTVFCLSLHICWDLISRINFKQEAKWLVIFTFNRRCQIALQKDCVVLPSYHQLMEVPISPSPGIRQPLALWQTHGWKIISHFYLYFLIFSEIRHLSGMCFPSVSLFLWTVFICFIHFFIGMFFVSFQQYFSTYSVVDIVFASWNRIKYVHTPGRHWRHRTVPMWGIPKTRVTKPWILWDLKHLITNGLGPHLLFHWKIEKYSNSCPLFFVFLIHKTI